MALWLYCGRNCGKICDGRVKQLLGYAKKEHLRNFPGLEAEWGVSRPYSQPISMRNCEYHQSHIKMTSI
jgi:hypothetical protein